MIREFSDSIVEIVWSEKVSFVAGYKFSRPEEGWQCSKGGGAARRSFVSRFKLSTPGAFLNPVGTVNLVGCFFLVRSISGFIGTGVI
jgi:hypothetical protein